MKAKGLSNIAWIVLAASITSIQAQTFNSPVGANAGNYLQNTNSLWVGDQQYGLNSFGGVVRVLNTINGGQIAFRLNLNGIFADAMSINGAGNVGIGTSTPQTSLSIAPTTDGSSFGSSADKLAFFDDGTYFTGLTKFSGSMGGLVARGNTSIGFYINPNYGHNATNDKAALLVTTAGNVGIGTTTPGTSLEINGSVKLTPNSGASMTYADGTVQSTAWNGTTLGGDYAESVDVLGDRAGYEPGDVIVIDVASPGRFEKSSKAYSKLVAGVYSTKPGLVGRRLTFERANKAAEVPMAMLGIVPTKVTAENGAIEPGDLLVSASKPGCAMKGTDSSCLTGAVLGKALAPLNSGDGVIEAIISIQ